MQPFNMSAGTKLASSSFFLCILSLPMLSKSIHSARVLTNDAGRFDKVLLVYWSDSLYLEGETGFLLVTRYFSLL